MNLCVITTIHVTITVKAAQAYPQDSINELIILCYENFSVFRRIENIWMDEIS